MKMRLETLPLIAGNAFHIPLSRTKYQWAF
jgi:hypothetical protein